MTSLFDLLISHPWIALLPGLAFAIAGLRRRSAPAFSAAVVWVLYAAYETGMRYRILCTGECNIRLDLFVIYPLLLLVSVVAVLFALLKHRT
jgi:hypothetical protein